MLGDGRRENFAISEGLVVPIRLCLILPPFVVCHPSTLKVERARLRKKASLVISEWILVPASCHASFVHRSCSAFDAMEVLASLSLCLHKWTQSLCKGPEELHVSHLASNGMTRFRPFPNRVVPSLRGRSVKLCASTGRLSVQAANLFSAMDYFAVAAAAVKVLNHFCPRGT